MPTCAPLPCITLCGQQSLKQPLFPLKLFGYRSCPCCQRAHQDYSASRYQVSVQEIHAERRRSSPRESCSPFFQEQRILRECRFGHIMKRLGRSVNYTFSNPSCCKTGAFAGDSPLGDTFNGRHGRFKPNQWGNLSKAGQEYQFFLLCTRSDFGAKYSVLRVKVLEAPTGVPRRP